MNKVLESSYYVELLELIKKNGIEYFNRYIADAKVYYQAINNFNVSPVILISSFYDKYAPLFNLFKKYGKFSNRKEQYMKVQKIINGINDINFSIENAKMINNLGIDTVNLFIPLGSLKSLFVKEKNGYYRIIRVDNSTYYKKYEYVVARKIITDGIIVHSPYMHRDHEKTISGLGTIVSPYEYNEEEIDTKVYNSTFMITAVNSKNNYNDYSINVKNFEFNSSKLPNTETLSNCDEPNDVTEYKMGIVKKLKRNYY